MNVPVLSLKGYNFNSRCGQSININAGLNHFVAKNPEEYVQKAILYSQNLKKLENERKYIFKNILNTPLFNSKKFAKNFWNAIIDLL
jgi:predicted O-linked N-acetylglucosamine transferase (SPINDLY family)